jgi:hypothetical protein
MRKDRKIEELVTHPDVSVFAELEFALEEAEFMFKSTGKAHSVVALPDKKGTIEEYLVMEKSRAVATAAFILETFIAIDEGKASEAH